MEFEDLPEEVRAALEQGRAVVCFTACWPCQFGQHPAAPHTWMDEEDAEFAGHPWPLPDDAAAGNLCGCSCQSATGRPRRRPR